MAPKPREAPKKAAPTIIRCPISDSSLVFVPTDAVEGYQQRIETGIDWTLVELALRHHRQQYFDAKKFPTVTFNDALESKLRKSYVGNFLDETSTIPLKDQWDVILASKLWDNEKFATNEGKICFENANAITDNILQYVKEAVRFGDRQILWKNLRMVDILRVNNAEMTELDNGILEFERLVSLSLCGNCMKDIDGNLIPTTLKILELQVNFISHVDSFAELLPSNLLYLGLSKNLLQNETVGGLSRLPYNLSVLDISDNNIYDLELVLNALVHLHNLVALYLAGNPCSVCAGYARMTLTRLLRLKWLDARQILPKDRPLDPNDIFEIHPDDLRSTYFVFSVFRVMGVPQPPKSEKGATTAFHIELEIPLLDATRRQFLLFRSNEALIEMLPPPEDDGLDELPIHSGMGYTKSTTAKLEEASSHPSDIYLHMEVKNPNEIHNYTTFESNKIQWSKIMNFQEPTLKLFCPDLVALRNTFRSVITIRLVYTVIMSKPAKPEKKSAHSLKLPGEQRVVLATIRCALKNPDWTQPSQHFHWDDTLGTNDAIHWGDGDLAVLQYSQQPVKAPKGKMETDTVASSRHNPPENLTCHFGFGIDTLKP